MQVCSKSHKKSYNTFLFRLWSWNVVFLLCVSFKNFIMLFPIFQDFFFNHLNTLLHHVLDDNSIHLIYVLVLISNYLLNKSILLWISTARLSLIPLLTLKRYFEINFSLFAFLNFYCSPSFLYYMVDYITNTSIVFRDEGQCASRCTYSFCIC